MIEFLRDYVTEALPPEKFAAGDQVKRSGDSELYFVRLGVAAYVTKDGLVDEGHKPIIVRQVVAEVVDAGDRRRLFAGRAGELAIGVDAPPRATSGPGNAALFGADQQSVAIAAQFDQVAADRDAEKARADDLDTQLTTLRGDHDAAGAALAEVQRQLAEAVAARDAAVERSADLSAKLDQATKDHDAEKARADDLTAQFAAATKPKVARAGGES